MFVKFQAKKGVKMDWKIYYLKNNIPKLSNLTSIYYELLIKGRVWYLIFDIWYLVYVCVKSKKTNLKINKLKGKMYYFKRLERTVCEKRYKKIYNLKVCHTSPGRKRRRIKTDNFNQHNFATYVYPQDWLVKVYWYHSIIKYCFGTSEMIK